MNEHEYQIEIRDLWSDMQQRADSVVDYLVTQPPLKLARQELYTLLEWALTAGAEHQPAVQERIRRRKMARALRENVGQANEPRQ